MSDIQEPEPLKDAIERTRRADHVRPRQINVSASQIVVLLCTGTVDAEGFHETFRDSITLRDEVNEDGTPGPQHYTNAMNNTSLAEKIRSAPKPVMFQRIMREACSMIMRATGMVE